MIVWSAIKRGNKIYTGCRHADIIRQMIKSGEMPPIDEGQGFVNEKGEFLTREEAELEAFKCNQVKNKKLLGSVLTSEDLW